MDNKQPKNMHLDSGRQRTVRILLSLLLVLSLLYVAMEYTSTPTNYSDGFLLEELVQDMEMMPPPESQDMAIETPPDEPVPTVELRVVDKPVEQLETLNEINQQRLNLEGDGEEVNEDDLLPPDPVAVDDNDRILDYRIVEQLPEFPGGMSAYVKWLSKNLRYPLYARQKKIEGKVLVTFIINTDGSVSDIKVAEPVSPTLDQEAIRVMRLMPAWKPGIQDDKPCRTMFAVPVVFML